MKQICTTYENIVTSKIVEGKKEVEEDEGEINGNLQA